MKKYILSLLCFLVPISLSHAANDDIPYEDNDNSYVVIPNYTVTEDDTDTEFKFSKKAFAYILEVLPMSPRLASAMVNRSG